VKKGQLLFRIDARPFQAEVNRLRGELTRARSQLEFATLNDERSRRLLAANVISVEAADKEKSEAGVATGALAAATGALDAARLNLEFTEVRSPIAGRASRVFITPGNLVSSSSVLTSVVSDDRVYAYFDADERTFLRFDKGFSGAARRERPVFLGLVDEAGYPHEGTLNFLDNQIDRKTGTIRARAVFSNADGRFAPGLFARIKLVGSASRETLLIEDRAVGTNLGKKFVFALRSDSTLDYRLVTLGTTIDGLRIVREGLKPGELIVINGLQHVRPGMKVVATRAAMAASRPSIELPVTPDAGSR
jgi:multidrug efflux system membrane fusion protein